MLLAQPFILQSQTTKDSISLYYNAIVDPHISTDIAKGIKFYSNKKDQSLKRKDTLTTIKYLRMIALGQLKVGFIYDSENTLTEALTLIDSYAQKDTLKENKKALYNQLGNIYRALNKHEKAIEAYDQALVFSKNLSDSISLINNKANIYKDTNEYQKAANQLNLIYKKAENNNEALNYASILDNLGYVQSKLGDPQALSNLKSALQIRESFNNLSGLYSSHKNLARYYFDRGDKEKAKLFINKAYENAVALNSLSYLEDILSEFAAMSDDPKMNLFKKITDSITNRKQLAENKNALIKYNVANEKNKTAEALLEREKEKNYKLIYLGLGIFIIISSIFFYIIMIIKHKKEKIAQIHSTEKRISKIIHDEVANDVYHLMTKIQLTLPESDILLDDLDDIYKKARDVSRDNASITIHPNFGLQLKELLQSYQQEGTVITVQNISQVNWKAISSIKKITIYRVLQELMINMKKHSKASQVLISFQKAEKKLQIKYVDNGVGCYLKNKNGLENMETRIKVINGNIKFETSPEKGFKTIIKI